MGRSSHKIVLELVHLLSQRYIVVSLNRTKQAPIRVAHLVDKPADEQWPVWAYYAVALFGAAMTPYEVFFFSSGGVEEGWTEKSLTTMRANVFVGFPLGGLLSLAIAGSTAVVFGPLGASVDTLGQVGLPVAVALGKIGLAVSPANPERVWAIVEADSGGVFRSDDGGATWTRVNAERGRYAKLHLPERFGGRELPHFRAVDL